MDDLRDRYARLVAAFGAEQRTVADLNRVAGDAAALAAMADSTWMRVQARALAEAARAAAGNDANVEVIVDASVPPIDGTALARLEDLLPAGPSLTERIAAHESATRLPSPALPVAADRLLDLLRRRATEDLALPADHRLEVRIADEPAASWSARLESSSQPARLVLNGSVAWTADGLIRAISSYGYPGRHLTRLMRPASDEWSPSPETTIESGLGAVGIEVLLADHELAHELERIGRATGVEWDAGRIVAVRHAIEDLAPARAAAALGDQGAARGRLLSLGANPRDADALVAAWREPLARARTLGVAAGPPLVRAWLAAVGQTTGLQRLLIERLVPTMLRAEMPDARD